MREELMSLMEEVRRANARLIAVSKTRTPEEIKRAYDLGLRDFGENRVQELLGKYEQLPADIHWHLIGHLQKNKVKYIAPFIACIHSVDSLDLLKVIDKEGFKNQRIIPVLLQIKIAEEETKYGLDEPGAEDILASYVKGAFPHVRIVGLMGMATFTEDLGKVRLEFRKLARFLELVKKKHPDYAGEWSELSMGMSSDFEAALEEGSTMVRIGTLIFGPRD